MSSANLTDLVLRPATRDDAATLAEVHTASRSAAVRSGSMPPSIHAAVDIQPWLAGRLERDDVWVAEVAGAAVAYLRLSDAWLDDLYVVPARVGQGIGSALLEIAKVLRPAGFGLWVFETNHPARAFYAAHGMVEVERTDGRDNEERAPDLRMVWAP
ncbi:MAG: GNAT family N-acetyltransferase [Nocardioides sp.]